MRTLFTIVLLASGCGYQQGFVRDAASSQVVKYELAPKAVTFIRPVRGEASTGAILCMIPIDDVSLYADAMKHLYEKAQLQGGQTLMNLREDAHLTSWLGLYCTRKLVVSGDVMAVSFDKPPPPKNIHPPVQQPTEEEVTESNRKMEAAMAAYKSGDHQAALTLAVDVSSKVPSLPDPYRVMGLVQYQTGLYRSAKSNLEKYLRLNQGAEDDSQVLKVLAAIRRLQKEQDE